ncbi:MAG: hypothetical protein O9346_01910 [Leptospiraceae bacterium]|jgi:hypothetical protein|nr:hypothetical protein [Leptospiraceae bacterium]
MINEQFAYLTNEDGEKFQVLKYDENGIPIDWDEQATAELFNLNS